MHPSHNITLGVSQTTPLSGYIPSSSRPVLPRPPDIPRLVGRRVGGPARGEVGVYDAQVAGVWGVGVSVSVLGHFAGCRGGLVEVVVSVGGEDVWFSVGG